MTKHMHDTYAADKRKICYTKEWYLQGLKVFESIRRRNFQMLEIGAGNGEFSELIRKKYAADITCLDYAEPHLNRLKELGFPTVRCDFDVNDDIERLKADFGNSFDIVVSLEVIEHLFDVDAFLECLYCLLRPNGLLLISTPNVAYISYRIYSLFRDNLPVSEGHHIRFFTQRRLEQTLRLNGFELLKDFSYGNGSFYLDRAIGEGASRVRALAIKAIFYLWLAAARNSWPSRFSGILFLAAKGHWKPIGLDPGFRRNAFARLTDAERHAVLHALLPLRKKGFFNEHPMLTQFLDHNAEEMAFGAIERSGAG